MRNVADLDLTPTQDTVLLHFASSLPELSAYTKSSDVLKYIVAGTDKRPMDVAKTLKKLFELGLIEATVGPSANGKDDVMNLSGFGIEYLASQGWKFDKEKTKTNTTEKPKKARKPRRDRADNAPAGLPSDADAETLKSNREEMAKTLTSSSHANCDHESTKAARSACRKARAAAAAN